MLRAAVIATIISLPCLAGDTLPDGPVERCDRVVRDGYASIQVNVDARGCNILGDAANETTLAVDPTDPRRMVIGWRQFDDPLIRSADDFVIEAGYAYSHDAGHTWVFGGVLDKADNFIELHSDPVLDAGPDGTFYYAGTRFKGEPTLFKSHDGGLTWEGLPGFSGDKPWMDVDNTDGIGTGHIYIGANGGFGFVRGLARSVDGGRSFLELTDIPLVPLTLSVGPDGTLYLVDAVGCVIRSLNAKDAQEVPAFQKATCAELGGGYRFSRAEFGRPAWSNLRRHRPLRWALAGKRLFARERGSTSRQPGCFVLSQSGRGSDVESEGPRER